MAIYNPLYSKDVNNLSNGKTPQLRLSSGGQQGIMPGNFQFSSNAAYVQQKMTAVLIAAPSAMAYLPNSEEYIATLKNLIEVMATDISGLTSTQTHEFSEATVGNAGEKFSSVVNAARAVSAPSFTWPEKYGEAITRFWTEVNRQLLMDPDLGYPGVVTEPLYLKEENPPAIVAERQAFTVLFYEPSPDLQHITKAWLCTNMMGKSSGELTGKRTIASAGETKDVSIEFTALTMIGSAVNTMAQEHLSSLALADLRPLDLKPYTDVFDGLSNGVTGDVGAVADSFVNRAGTGDTGVVQPAP